MLLIIGGGLLLLICFGPMAWANLVLKRHASERSDFPGTGGELARHLLDLAGLQHVGLETTATGDHYSPKEKVVRLTKDRHDGRSLTAVAVAAHEVSHALQDRDGYRPLKWRTHLAVIGSWGERIAHVLLIASPASLLASPRLAMLQIAFGITLMLGRVVLHLMTLPVEFDASFKRALPILEGGNYLKKEDLAGAKAILRACAWTYVAGALFSVIDIVRWIRFGR
ncbi:MAG: zinc metallopeptidase [Geminicoccaceae bacterium]